MTIKYRVGVRFMMQLWGYDASAKGRGLKFWVNFFRAAFEGMLRLAQIPKQIVNTIALLW